MKRKGKEVLSGSPPPRAVRPKGESIENDQVNEVDMSQLKKMSLGHNAFLTKRYHGLLDNIFCLVTSMKCEPEVAEQKLQILDKKTCSHAVYMEWINEEEVAYLWMSDIIGQIKIMFEVNGVRHAVMEERGCGYMTSESLLRPYHDKYAPLPPWIPNDDQNYCQTVFEARQSDLKIQKPLLAFSVEFEYGDGWSQLKELLKQIFGASNEELQECQYDYMLLFTRVGDTLYFRNYKIHSMVPINDMKLKLEAAHQFFALKPREIHSSGSTRVFLDQELVLLESNQPFNLTECDALSDCSSQLVWHRIELDCPDFKYPDLLLPAPADVSKFHGFNSTCDEYFSRYPTYKASIVPGTGPDPQKHVPAGAANSSSYEEISDQFKVFARSLISYVGVHHTKKKCLRKFSRKNIFLRKGEVTMFGVRFAQYTRERAQKTLRRVAEILQKSLHGMSIPHDVTKALLVLQRDPLEDLHLMVNNVAWMDGMNRNHMVSDLNNEFRNSVNDHMDQLVLLRLFPHLSDWEARCRMNWLMEETKNFSLPKTPVRQQNYLKNKVMNLEQYFTDKVNAQMLFDGQQLFNTLRNCCEHLPDTSAKRNMTMAPEVVNTVVSSEFASAYPVIQEFIPQALAGNIKQAFKGKNITSFKGKKARQAARSLQVNKPALFKRFEKYFPCASIFGNAKLKHACICRATVE